MLLDLKQKQASVSEADYARQEAVETTSQGRIILVFTSVTIVFVSSYAVCTLWDDTYGWISATAFIHLGDIQHERD
jgi:hypothetical protein